MSGYDSPKLSEILSSVEELKGKASNAAPYAIAMGLVGTGPSALLDATSALAADVYLQSVAQDVADKLKNAGEADA